MTFETPASAFRAAVRLLPAALAGLIGLSAVGVVGVALLLSPAVMVVVALHPLGLASALGVTMGVLATVALAFGVMVADFWALAVFAVIVAMSTDAEAVPLTGKTVAAIILMLAAAAIPRQAP